MNGWSLPDLSLDRLASPLQWFAQDPDEVARGRAHIPGVHDDPLSPLPLSMSMDMIPNSRLASLERPSPLHPAASMQPHIDISSSTPNSTNSINSSNSPLSDRGIQRSSNTMDNQTIIQGYGWDSVPLPLLPIATPCKTQRGVLQAHGATLDSVCEKCSHPVRMHRREPPKAKEVKSHLGGYCIIVTKTLPAKLGFPHERTLRCEQDKKNSTFRVEIPHLHEPRVYFSCISSKHPTTHPRVTVGRGKFCVVSDSFGHAVAMHSNGTMHVQLNANRHLEVRIVRRAHNKVKNNFTAWTLHLHTKQKMQC